MRMLARTSFTLALLLAIASSAMAQSSRLAGRWTGSIVTPGPELQVDVTFTATDDAVTGTISIPQQNAQDLPLAGIRAPGDSAIFAIQGVPGDPTFLGVFSGDTVIAGAFRQAGANMTFRLRRSTEPAVPAADPLEGFDAVVEKALTDFLVPGIAIGVYHRGRPIYTRGFGYRDVAQRLPVTPQTLFAIGSSTKAFTTFALAQQADAGRFDWDEPVREYLPGLQLWDDVTTLQLTGRDMVTHRTGLPRHDLTWYNAIDRTPEELFERLRHLEPNRRLREAWQYNNVMYVMAGYLLGRLTDGTWSQAVQRQILDPVGMTATNFSVTEMQRAPDHALPYRESGDTLVRIPFRNIDQVGPAGSINSSVEDMLKWVAVHVQQGRVGDTTIIRSATLRDIHTPHMVMPGFPTEAEISPAGYGLGWMIATYRGKYRVQHGGNIDGFSALVTLYPRDQLAVVALTNKNGTPLPSLITDHIADRVLSLPARDWLGEMHRRLVAARAANRSAQERLAEERRTGTRPTFPLAAYAGDYEHPGYGTLRIEQRNNRLVMRFNHIETPLEHWHYDVFSGVRVEEDPTFANAKLQFTTDLRGRIAGLQIALEQLLPPFTFERGPDAELTDPQYLARLAGDYQMEAGGLVAFRVSGSALRMEVPGQPPYTLVPGQDNEFEMKELPGYAVRFVMENGTVREVRMIQPNGVFIARRAPASSSRP